MARFLSIEAESTQIRVGEVEISGRKGRMLQCFCVPVPQGSVEDGLRSVIPKVWGSF